MQLHLFHLIYIYYYPHYNYVLTLKFSKQYLININTSLKDPINGYLYNKPFLYIYILIISDLIPRFFTILKDFGIYLLINLTMFRLLNSSFHNLISNPLIQFLKAIKYTLRKSFGIN
jgi:hypothetical protein